MPGRTLAAVALLLLAPSLGRTGAESVRPAPSGPGVTQQLLQIDATLAGADLPAAIDALRTELLYLPDGERRLAVALALQSVSGSPESVGRLASRLAEPAQAALAARMAVRAWTESARAPAVARRLKLIRRESWELEELRSARAERRSSRHRERDLSVRQLRRALRSWERRDADLTPAVGAWLAAYGAQGPGASLEGPGSGGSSLPAPRKADRVVAFFFDIDDNVFLKLPTRIILFAKASGDELAISTEEFALLADKIGRSDEPVQAGGRTFNAKDFEFRKGIGGSFREFTDADGRNNFLPAIRRAVETLPPSAWQGPSWNAFVRAMSDPENARRTAVITARGHRPESYIEAFRYLQEKGFIKYVPRAENMHGVDGAPDRSKAKLEVLKGLLDRIQAEPISERAEKVVDQDGTGLKALHTAGFSDDDWKNIEAAAEGLREALRQDPKRWDKVKIVLFFTGTRHPTQKPGVYVVTSTGELRPARPQERSGAQGVETGRLVEVLHSRAPRPYDKPNLVQAMAEGRLAYGAELRSANPVSAATLADHPALSTVFIDASSAERGSLSAVVRAVGHAAAVVIGRFRSAADPYLKPKLDEGLLGAMLEKAGSLKETLRFLRRLYTPPLGERSVGPSDVTGYLAFSGHFIGKNNDRFIGAVSISDARGVEAIGAIVKAKARGLRLIEADAAAIARSLGVKAGSPGHRAALEKVEAAAREAGVPLSGRAGSRAEAAELHARGYRHVLVTTDVEALDAAFDAFADVPGDPSREAAPGEAIRDWLRAGRVGHLGFLTTPDVELAKRMAERAHGVWLDAEDGQFSLERIRAIIAALPRDRPALVRAAEPDDPQIAGYLTAGAAGVVAPQVRNAGQARRFVEEVKRSNPGAAVVVMIENRQALSDIEAIAAVPGIDALFIGPYDLALSLQVPSGSPAFQAALARIETAARAAGVPLGGLARTRSESYRLRERGYGFLAAVYDQTALAHAFHRALSGLGAGSTR